MTPSMAAIVASLSPPTQPMAAILLTTNAQHRPPCSLGWRPSCSRPTPTTAAILVPPTLTSSRHDAYRTHGSHYEPNGHGSHLGLDLCDQRWPSWKAGGHLVPKRCSTAAALPRSMAAILLVTHTTNGSHLEPNHRYPVA